MVNRYPAPRLSASKNTTPGSEVQPGKLSEGNVNTHAVSIKKKKSLLTKALTHEVNQDEERGSEVTFKATNK